MTISAVDPPRTSLANSALRWLTDQIIRSQPGAYVLPHPDGGELWVCPFGSGKSAHRIDTGPGTVEAHQFVEVFSSGGHPRIYEVMISIREVNSERSEADHEHEKSGELPRPDGVTIPDRAAEPASQSQGS